MEITRIILDICILLLGGYYILYKSYMKEKGKNLATKEDIQEITDKMESVKIEYLRQMEDYKKEINLKYEIESFLIDSKKEAYMKAQDIKLEILKRKHIVLKNGEDNMVNILNKVPELMFFIESHTRLKESTINLVKRLKEEHIKFLVEIDRLTKIGATKYTFNIDELEKIIEGIQKKITE